MNKSYIYVSSLMLVLISYKPADLTIMTSFRLSKLMLGNYLIFHS